MYEILTQLLVKVRGMWRYRWYALIVAWVVCVIGWVAVFQLPNQYKTEARVFVDTQSVIKPLLKGLAVETDEQDKILLMTKALLSRPNLENVIRETDLDLRTKTATDYEALIQDLQGKIKISSPPRQQNFYLISFTDRDPKATKDVVRALLDSLVEQTLGANREDTESAQQFLLEQIKDYEQRLTEAEKRLAEFKKQNVGLMPNEAGSYYNRLQGHLNRVQNTESRITVALNRRNELMKQLKDEESMIGASELETKIHLRKTELNNLLLRFTDQHPDVIALQDTIKQLEARKDSASVSGGVEDDVSQNPVYQSIKIAIGEVDVELASLRAEQDGQRKQIHELQKLVDTMPEVEANLARLNRDYLVTKSQYEAMVERLESARLSEGIERSGDNIKFRIIDPPVEPLRPSGPNRLVFLAGVLAAALGLGIGLIFLLNELHPVFCTSDELMEDLGLPVLGVVTMKWSDQEKHRLKQELVYLISGLALLVVLFFVVTGIEFSGVLTVHVPALDVRGLS